jgi:hypothetical protein
MAVTRIKNNQITDSTITAQKIASQTLVGGLFAPDLTLNSNVSIIGNLTVSGGSSIVNSTNTYVNDPVVVFNNGYIGSLTGYDIGILVNRNLATLTGYGAVNTAWLWSEADSAFVGLATTDTGTGVVSINNSGFVNIKVQDVAAAGNVTVTGTLTAASLVLSGGGTLTGNVDAAYGTITNFDSSNVAITGGSITNTTVAGSTVDATVMTTANAQVSGGAISNTPINGSVIGANVAAAGTFTTLTSTSGITGTLQTAAQPNVTSVGTLTSLDVTGTATAGNISTTGTATVGTSTVTGNETVGGTLTATGVVTANSTVNSTSVSTGAIVTPGGVGIAKDVNIGGLANIGTLQLSGNTVSSLSGDIVVKSTTGAVKIGALTMPQVDGPASAVMTTDGAGNLSLQSLAGAGVTGNLIILGTPTTGTLTDNNPAITNWVSTTKVTDAVDRLNEVLGKLVPTQPATFPGTYTLAIASLAPAGTLRMTNFVQTDNSGTGGRSIAGGTTISAYKRVATYAPSTTINDVGPGDQGTVSVMKNGATAGSRTIVSGTGNNGTYSDLIISDNADYGSKSSQALGFWYSFDATASGTVAAGWNDLYLTDTSGSPTNTVGWYYDAAAPGTPVITQSSFAVTSNVVAYSSSIPHYTSAAQWTYSGTVNRLSGDLYPATDSFFTGSAAGSFQAPATVTYTAAGVTTPLARNLYVSSGSATVSTTASIANSTGVSSTGPTVSAANSYATGSLALTPGGNVLRINTASTATPNENNIVVGTFGSGGASSAVRVGGLATGATPTTGGIASWTSSAALPTYEATVVGGTIKNDTTNYSTGYFPVGPDLSTGRTGTQYITFRITRDATSKFDISLTGKISGVQVALPGSSLGTTASPTNGWIDATVAYGGAGTPGTGPGGNGSVGCALGGAVTVGSLVTQSNTVTFGTESSHNSTGNYIYVRFALAAGDSITALSFPNATH